MNSATGLRVLIVDDATHLRRIVHGLLDELGCQRADEAEDGAVALQMLKKQRYDLVLTDINMPNLNGFELLKAIKADAKLLHLPVLLVMAEATPEDILMATENGAAGYLIKPFGKVALQRKLYRAERETRAGGKPASTLSSANRSSRMRTPPAL